MATMVKEKRRGKKKAREKRGTAASNTEDGASTSVGLALEDIQEDEKDYDEMSTCSSLTEKSDVLDTILEELTTDLEDENMNKAMELCTVAKETENEQLLEQATCSKNIPVTLPQKSSTDIDYKDLNDSLKRTVIPESSSKIDEKWLENPDSYLQSKSNEIPKELNLSVVTPKVCVMPSAPMSSEQVEPGAPPEEELIQDEIRNKVIKKCMPLEEAVRIYGRKELAVVKEMCEREAEMSTGATYPKDHPLVDLLTTLKSSIKEVEYERIRLARKFDEEEKFRSTLWKVEKQYIHLTEQCKCNLKVDLKFVCDHAELMKEKLPVAKLKLQALLKDFRESYCVYQHEALLAHCRIDELVAETIEQGDKNNIRIVLSLILLALRACDGAPEVLAMVLQRWAEALAGALVDEKDLRQLFFILHQLFRQTRSVLWASRVIHMRVTDNVTAVHTLVALETLLSKQSTEAAVECDEAGEGTWEEVDARGAAGAVSEGALRERDLLALLRALPLRQLAARLVLFPHTDFSKATELEWGDASGGRGLLKSCCGVRALLGVLRRGSAHAGYGRLHAAARALAARTLAALAALHRSPRAPYRKDLEDTITAELHAVFAEAFALFGTHDLDNLPTLLLSDDAAKDYCLTFIVGLHDKCRKSVESLSLRVPVLGCEQRLRAVVGAATQRLHDHDLARIVLDFLLQTGLVRKSTSCKSGCEAAARECLPELLKAHPYLRCLALHTIAEMAQVETLEPSAVSALHVQAWRPDETELLAVLDDWAQRCPALLQPLLMQLDFTPHTGIALEVQLHAGRWLCHQPAAEAWWGALLRLRAHRAAWRLPTPAPPAPDPADLMSMAFAVLAFDWGHSIPLICSQGVNAISTLCATRPREAVHCLAPVMLVMAQSPESVSLTPKFGELFTILLSCGPNLVQRALGRGGASGAELLLRLVLHQVSMKQPYVFPAWLHALWKVPAALSILDIAALAVRDWHVMDAYANTLVREENSKELLANAVRFAFTSPLLCECLLRAAHTQEVSCNLFHSLLTALCRQRAASQRVHVDNALQKINPNMTSEDLVVHICANAALVAPFQHPSHLTLWRLFFHMYLERPRDIDPRDPAYLPGGPLIFSGLIKSRSLAQIKKRLLETAAFHQNEAESYTEEPVETPVQKNQATKSESSVITAFDQLLPPLKITDFTPDWKSDSEDSDTEGETTPQSVVVDRSTEEAMELQKKRNALLASYHTGAEKMMRAFARWLDDGEKVQAMPPNADIARFIPPQALEEAWSQTLSRCRPPPNPELDTFISPAQPPPLNANLTLTPLQVAMHNILKINCRSGVRTPKKITPMVEGLNERSFYDVQRVVDGVSELLNRMEKYAEEWEREVCRVSAFDGRLLEAVCGLRVPRPLPPVKRQCANKCPPVVFYPGNKEWRISANAEHAVREYRVASLTSISVLAQPRPGIVIAAANLYNIAKRVRSTEQAVAALELAWRCAGTCRPCDSVHAAIALMFDTIVERWVLTDGSLCNRLLEKSCVNNLTPLQHTLCGSLVSPCDMQYVDWGNIYMTLLGCSLPHNTLFSYLSRFDVVTWSDNIEEPQRHAVLNALLDAAISAAAKTGNDTAMLQELIGVHSSVMVTPRMLMWLLMECTRISVAGFMPLSYWKHLIVMADRMACDCSIEDLSTGLRGIGGLWCTADRAKSERHATYAMLMSELISILIREYEAAAIRLTYLPERVTSLVWALVVAAFSPWVHPKNILPDPANSSHYVSMLQRFTSCIRQTMRDCPGSEALMLQYVYTSAIATYQIAYELEPRPLVHMAAWLEHMLRLPWAEHQWFTALCMPTLIKVVIFNVDELCVWACDRIAATKTVTLMSGCDPNNIETYLTNCLKIFAGYKHVTDADFLDSVSQLPWWKLSEAGLKEGLKCFFGAHYNVNTPYHEYPHAAVIINAAELNASNTWSPGAHGKRRALVAHWTHVYSDAALAAHAAAYTRHMLHRITFMAPYASCENEKVDLLHQLAVMLEFANSRIAGEVLEAWLSWLLSAPLYVLGAAVEVGACLRVSEYTAPLADNAIRLYLLLLENHWYMIKSLWARHAQQPHQYVEQGALYAAYASAIKSRVQYVRPYNMITKLQALVASNAIDYDKNEGIVALWICYLFRLVTECDEEIAKAKKTAKAKSDKDALSTDLTSSTESTSSIEIGSEPTDLENTQESKQDKIKSESKSKFKFLVLVPTSAKEIRVSAKKHRKNNRFGFTIEERECCKQAALSILASWGQLQRRSLLKVVTLQADTERPTVRHRALVRLVDCILRPSPEATKAYQAAISVLAGNYSDVITWGHSASGRKLIRLAIRLLPAVPDRYFHYEVRFWPGD